MNYEYEARQLIAKLEVISHAPAMNMDPMRAGSDEKGGNRPPGAISAKDDREPGYAQKSHIYFRRWYMRCVSDRDFERLVRDAEAALEAWRRTPAPPVDSKPWQELVAREPGSTQQVADRWNLSKSRVHQLRQQYKRAA